MRDPRETSELEAMMERLRDRFRDKNANDMQEMAEIIMGLAAHIHRLENVLQVAGHPDSPKSATLKLDNSSITIRPAGIAVRCNDISLLGSHNVAIQAQGNLAIQAEGHLKVNNLRIQQTGAGATLDGGAELELRGTKIVQSGQDSVSIRANKIDIMADGDLRLKGSKISEN